MAKKKIKSRAQIELTETVDMSQAELEKYMLTKDYITPELAARYLGGYSSIRISPERTIKFKHGDLVLNEDKVSR